MKFHYYENVVLRLRSAAKTATVPAQASIGAIVALFFVLAAPSPAAIYDFSPVPGPLLASPIATGVTLSLNGANPTNINSGGTPNFIRNMNGVAAWSVGGTVYSYLFDPTRQRWTGTSSSHGAVTITDLSSADGVVAWSVPNGNAFYRIYNPASGTWVTESGTGPIAQTRILNTNGVVAWSYVNPNLNPPNNTTIFFRVYDPTRTGWMPGSVANVGAPSDLRTLDGVVTWSSRRPDNTFTVYYYVYDPGRGQWREGTANPNSLTTLRITNSQVSWTEGTSTKIVRGYDPGPGVWDAIPVPLAYFAVSTNAGNAPFTNLFIDMSIGATSWQWTFGDGSGTSSKRSPFHGYLTFGRYTATLNVTGGSQVSSASQAITTDLIPPVGTNLINNGAPFTTNPIVTLTLSAIDNSGLVTEMRFSNNNGVNWSAWENYSTTKVWTLSAGNEAKIVSAQFRDAAGNVSGNANDGIELDTTPPPVVSFVNTNVLEADGAVTVLAILDHPLSQTVSIRYSTADGTATAPGDYIAKTGLLTFPPNQTNASFTIQVVPDGVVELNETILLNFSDATNTFAGPQGIITVLDDETPTVSFANAVVTVAEDGGAGVVMVRLDAASGKTVTVAYQATNGTATAGVDFTAVEGVLIFAPGETTQPIAVPIIDESLDEFSETVLLTLSAPDNANLGNPAAATLTILDNDNPLVFFSRSNYVVLENSGAAVISVWLSKPFAQSVEADYTAFGGTATPGFPGDYFAASGRLTFAPNTTNQTFFVNLVNDSDAERDETVHLTLSNIENASAGLAAADIVITDDDGPPRLVSPRLNASQQFQVTLSGKTNQKFSLEFSTNLSHWLPLVTLTNTTGTLEFTDPNLIDWPPRFYRTRVP